MSERKSLRVLVGMPDRASLGGPAACEPPFVEGLRRLGATVGEETYVYGDKLAGTRTFDRAARVLDAARRLRQRLRAEPFDIVHLNTSFDARALLRDALVVPLLGARAAKVFLKFHGSDAALLQTRNPLMRALVRYLLTRADAIGVLSTEEKNNFTRAGVNDAKVFVVKNVVEREFPERAADFNARVGVAADVPVLLFIARFIPAKGLLDVIRACHILRERGHEFALLCVGDGPARAEAEREVAALGLEAVVRFLGFIPEAETAELYANSTALVFPTYHYEGFPMTIFYAVAAGRPVITTRIRAAADYLNEPDNCLWVEPKNPKMLAEKIIQLLRDAPAREEMGRNNLQLARRFAALPVAEEYLEVYNRVLRIS